MSRISTQAPIGGRSFARSKQSRIPFSSRLRSTIVLVAALFIPLAIAQDAPPTAASAEPSEKSPRAALGLLLDVAYTGERLIAVGERGNIVASKDGHRWAQVEVPSRSTLTAVSFPDSQNGWAVGHDGSVLHTADGGKTWAIQRFQTEGSQPLLDVLFVSATRGYAVGTFGTFLVTDNGGQTWAELEAPAIREEGMHFHAITRLEDGSLLVVGERGLLGWSADGTTWERLSSPYEGSFFGVTSRGPAGAIVYGLRGNTFVADDPRANNWQKVELGSTRTAFGGAPLGSDGSIIVGADGLLTIVDGSGSVRPFEGTAVVGERRSGTVSSVVKWPGGLLTVGDVGVQLYNTK